MISKGTRVKILRGGVHKGETGKVINIFPVVISEDSNPSTFIYEVEIDYDFLYDPIEYVLVKEDELTTNFN